MDKKNEVQSFLQQEVEDLVLDPVALDEWHSMVKEMGLDGQGSIAEPGKSPIPYTFMTPSMVSTFETLCPREVELKEYKAGPIPLKALELIKLAQREGHFDRIMIRYDDKAPDPVAIGEKGHLFTYGTNGAIAGVEDWRPIPAHKMDECRAAGFTLRFNPDERFLIARWGAESDTLENLAVKAKGRYLRQESATLSKAINDAKAKMATLEDEATLKFNC